MLVCVGESWNDHNSPWHKASMQHSYQQIPYNQAFRLSNHSQRDNFREARDRDKGNRRRGCMVSQDNSIQFTTLQGIAVLGSFYVNIFTTHAEYVIIILQLAAPI